MDKVFLNLAGEFLAAAELNRRKILCSVTYGAAKSADIFAFGEESSKLVRLEVKTTTSAKARWPVGARALIADTRLHLWVLVLLPEALNSAPTDDTQRGHHAPRFFVLNGSEIAALAGHNCDAYAEQYRGKHGLDFPREKMVPIITIKQAAEYEAAWQKVYAALSATA